MIEPVTAAIVALYFITLIVIGAWASRKIHNTEDYIVAGRSLGFWVFTILMISSVCSGMTLLGVSGLGFNAGWPSIWEQLFVPLAASFCIIVFGVKLHRIARKNNYMTVEDYFANRFESPKAMRSLAAVAGIIVSLIYLIGQYTAISIVLVWLFGIPHWQALLAAGIIITGYTVVGGLYAVSWTTVIQGGLLIVGVLAIAPLLIAKAGGLTHINEVMGGIDPALVQPYLTTGNTFTPAFLLSFGLLLTVGLACAPHVINNVLAAKQESYFRWSPLIAFAVYAVVIVLVKFAGFAGRVLVEEGSIVLPDVSNASDFIFVSGIEYAIPNLWVWSFFAVIVLAAVMSTTDRLMLTVGSMFAWDIWKNVFRPSADDREVLLVSRVSVVIAAGGTLLLAVNPPDMLAWLMWSGIGIMLSTFAVPLLAGLYWRGATREGALASMAIGLVSGGALGYWYYVVEKLPVHFSLYAVILSAVAMVVVSLATQKTDHRVLDATLTGGFIQPR
ncbi:sodium:solute symporter family protein [Methanofollis fontis]|uniref:Sodium:solute symporter n=1 Tax=Methanofollis fontis TaxID=2052832 RepID=A0A483CRG4_9EURY|nr:sodium:solute symporter family protein [Methanofollis fontis]TAJ43911.1 sodium:solute symporter [Methanofollis fontis]